MIHEIWANPECREGKHANCDGRGWNSIQDEPCGCPCWCHAEKRALDDMVEAVTRAEEARLGDS